jgi:hypothetical protein
MRREYANVNRLASSELLHNNFTAASTETIMLKLLDVVFKLTDQNVDLHLQPMIQVYARVEQTVQLTRLTAKPKNVGSFEMWCSKANHLVLAVVSHMRTHPELAAFKARCAVLCIQHAMIYNLGSGQAARDRYNCWSGAASTIQSLLPLGIQVSVPDADIQTMHQRSNVDKVQQDRQKTSQQKDRANELDRKRYHQQKDKHRKTPDQKARAKQLYRERAKQKNAKRDAKLQST